MNNHFLSWFSGFMDGEGYFGIVPNGKGFMAQASIKLRNDDVGILNRIYKDTGIGKVYNNIPSQNYATKGGEVHGQSKWQVCDIEGCVKLIEIFDNYPLIGKKAKIYKLWREAVLYMNENGTKRNAKLDDLYSKMSYVRKYSTK